MARNYDDETETITVKCAECGHDNSVKVRAEVEVNTGIIIREA